MLIIPVGWTRQECSLVSVTLWHTHLTSGLVSQQDSSQPLLTTGRTACTVLVGQRVRTQDSADERGARPCLQWSKGGAMLLV
jgi:hypothetical protein